VSNAPERSPSESKHLTQDLDELSSLGYKQELRRTLGFFSSFGVQFSMMAVGSTLLLTLSLGMNVFGPAMITSWVVGGILQLILGAAIAQLVSAYPLAGGVYQIIARLSGQRALAWQTGWLVAVAHIVSLPQLGVGLAPYVAGWFGVKLHGGGDVMLWAGGLILFVTLINLLSVKVSSFVNNIAIGAEMVGIVLIVGALLIARHPTQPIDILINSGGTANGGHWFGPFLWALLLPGLMISSFDSAGNASEETQGAARTAPRGLMIANTSSFLTGTVVIVLLLFGIQNLPEVVSSSEPMRVILNSTVGTLVTNIFVVLAMAALVGAMLVLQLTAARILFAQARDKQMPAASWFHKLNRESVPANATIVTAVVAMIFVVWSPAFDILSEMCGLAWGLGYAVAVVVGLWALLTKHLPTSPWSCGRWTAPVFWVSAVWGVALCVLFVWQDPLHIGLGMLVVVAAGLLVYRMIPAKQRHADWASHPESVASGEPTCETHL